jgi:phage terminase large subunit GpA-like protein
VTPYIVGIDQVKADILTSMSQKAGDPGAFRFSNSLDAEWFLQFTSERRAVVYVKGRPTITFERISGRAAEALDATVYGLAVRNLCRFDYPARETELSRKEPAEKKSFKDALARLHTR